MLTDASTQQTYPVNVNLLNYCAGETFKGNHGGHLLFIIVSLG